MGSFLMVVVPGAVFSRMAMVVIMSVVVVLIMIVIVTIMLGTMTMGMVMMVIVFVITRVIMAVRVAEAMGVGVDARHFATAAGVGLNPICGAQERKRVVQGGLLFLAAWRMLEAHQVEPGNFQFQTQISPIDSQISAGHAMHVRAVLALDLGQGCGGQERR